MSKELIICSLIVLFLIVFEVLHLVRKGKISIKYSLVWLFPCLIMFLFIIIPGFMEWASKTIGFQTASNMIIVLLIGFLFIINLALTTIVTNQKDKIRLLIQEISILKNKNR